MRRNAHRRASDAERGSALLIVFVFAAILAITLYMELPVVAFEAKRQKEQLLVDRGQEYAHAVKLYVRKFGMYPATIDQLENTNRMRFLRHRFKDPFTGKDDWRLLHAGPGGTLIDSKVKPAGGLSGLSNGATPNAGSGSTQTASSGFGSASTDSNLGSFGASSPTFSSGDTVVPPVPQRPPAISSSGAPSVASGNGESAATPAENDQSPTAPLLPPGETEQAAGIAQNASGAQPGNPGANAQAAQNGTPGTPSPAGASDSQNANDTMRKLLNNPGSGNPAIGAPLAGSGPGGAPLGQISGGGIAGVASKAKGNSIKKVNDQSDYSLWEFYYDPSKDATRGVPGAGQAGQQPGANTTGANTGFGRQNSAGPGQGGFGSGTTTATPAPTSPSNFGTSQAPPQ
jgi:hypothetical protein